jgi:glycosyltransferase involved in cell wall biosynthesis
VLQLIYESHGSPFGFGGAGVRAYEIYRRLRDRHEIDLVCMRYPGAVDGVKDGLRHVFLGAETRSLSRSVVAYTLKASAFVARYGHRYDVIVENFLPSTPFFARFRTRTPVVLQVQGVMEAHALRKFPPYQAAPMYLVERCYPSLYDKLVFVSEATKARVLARHRRAIALCEVVPNGVAPELLDAGGAEDDYILFFSRIDVYTKGLDVLMDAFAALSRRRPEVRLKLAGFAAADVAGLLARLPAEVRPRVEYVGFVEGAAKTALLSRAKFLVLPSRHESAPISILEGAACGKAVIASDIRELDFVEPLGLGLNFPSGEADHLRDRMEILLTNETLRKKMGDAGRAWAAGHSWDDRALAFEHVLKKAARGGEA